MKYFVVASILLIVMATITTNSCCDAIKHHNKIEKQELVSFETGSAKIKF